MTGINQQITLNTNTTIDLAPLGQFTHLKFTNATGAALYVLADVPDSAAPGAAEAHLAIPIAGVQDFEFDNASQAPSSFRVRTANTGYVHLLAW